MKPHNVPEAIDILEDRTASTTAREEAIHYLAENLTPEGVDRLAQALDDDQFGVRWAAARALAYAGDAALEPLLHVLIAKGGRPEVRDAAVHILRNSASPKVRDLGTNLVQALKGPAADIAGPQAAYELMRKLRTPTA